MKRIYKKLLFMIITFAFLILFNANKANAASATISGSRTVTQGESVTVTGSVTAGAWNLTLRGNGQSKSLVGQTSVVGNQSASTSISFTASNVGSYTFTLSGDITDFNTDQTTYPNSTCTITVVAKQPTPAAPAPNKSSGASSGDPGNTGSSGDTSNNNNNNNTNTVAAPTLSNLGITPHDFSGFSASRTAYTVNVPNDCTSVNLYASSKNGTVSGTGNKSLKEGTNKFSVTVTNSAGSKTYTVSVVRATASGEDVPNVIDQPDTEEQPEGIGLATLEIAGYNLDKEFKPDVYEYTIKVQDDITLDYLNEMKEKIKASANSENVSVEIVSNIDDDGKASFSIVVKDAEKEYAKYVIKVEKEEVEEEKEDNTAVAGIITDTPSNNPKGSGFSIHNIPFKNKMFIILGAYLITFLMAVSFAFIAYWKSKELAEYEYEYEDDEYDEDTERMGDLANIRNRNVAQEVEIAGEKINKTSGYRSLKNNGKSYGGKHY